jgi:hypothetical protein
MGMPALARCQWPKNTSSRRILLLESLSKKIGPDVRQHVRAKFRFKPEELLLELSIVGRDFELQCKAQALPLPLGQLLCF